MSSYFLGAWRTKGGVSLSRFPRLKAVVLEARLIHGNRVAGLGKLRLVQQLVVGRLLCPLPRDFDTRAGDLGKASSYLSET
jgi:hypothetical protein